ncbi:MAG: TIGR04255 family protein [Pseudomonadota bacterium]
MKRLIKDAVDNSSDIQYLKEYENPPVGEITIFFQFPRASSLAPFQLASKAKEMADVLGGAVIDSHVMPPQFETSKSENMIELGIGRPPPEAAFILFDEMRTYRIHMQADRFGVTWVRKSGEAYPRFEAVLKSFLDRFDEFQGCLGEALTISQSELQYVNLIPDDDQKALSYFRFMDLVFFQKYEGISFGTSQRLDDQNEVGRLYLEAQSQQRVIEASGVQEFRKFLNVFLTFRGKPSQPGINGAVKHLERGRFAIVKTFEQSLSDEGRKYFGEKGRTE